MKRRIHHHMRKYSRAFKTYEALDARDPPLTASLRDVQRHYKRKEAASRAMGSHRKALDAGDAISGALIEKPPGVTQLLCTRMMDELRCKALIEPWLAGERTLSHDEILNMATFVARKHGEPEPLPPVNTIRRQLARQFQKRVKPSGVDTPAT
jgi:hypothetical protein